MDSTAATDLWSKDAEVGIAFLQDISDVQITNEGIDYFGLVGVTS